jgi:hypothetical protein
VLGGAGTGIRQVLYFARPWQKVLLGAGVVGAGVALDAVLLMVLGGAVIVTTLFAWVRARRLAPHSCRKSAAPG